MYSTTSYKILSLPPCIMHIFFPGMPKQNFFDATAAKKPVRGA